MWDVLLDALWDSLKVFPFLLIIYIVIEILERRTSLAQNKNILQGNLAPLMGAATGLIPQCGFSTMAAKLYDRGVIRTGTIVAVFLATSDEALIIMLSSPNVSGYVMPLIAIKLIVAIGVGYLVNFLYSNEKLTEVGMLGDVQAHFCCEEHPHDGESDFRDYFLTPFLHSLKILFYIFIVNFVFGAIIYAVGEETLTEAIMGGRYVQPLITAAVGLIPNCASSVVLTEAFVKGGIYFGSFVGGLCSNAGLGLVVLFRNTKRIKRNVILTFGLYVTAVVVGIVVNAIAAAIAV